MQGTSFLIMREKEIGVGVGGVRYNLFELDELRRYNKMTNNSCMTNKMLLESETITIFFFTKASAVSSRILPVAHMEFYAGVWPILTVRLLLSWPISTVPDGNQKQENTKMRRATKQFFFFFSRRITKEFDSLKKKKNQGKAQ